MSGSHLRLLRAASRSVLLCVARMILSTGNPSHSDSPSRQRQMLNVSSELVAIFSGSRVEFHATCPDHTVARLHRRNPDPPLPFASFPFSTYYTNTRTTLGTYNLGMGLWPSYPSGFPLRIRPVTDCTHSRMNDHNR
jgi:hypothetical protein